MKKQLKIVFYKGSLNPRITCFLIFLVFAPVFTFSQVARGEMNARNIDFPQIIPLDGTWEFYWDQLYSPDKIITSKSYSRFPQLWSEIKSENTQGVATYKVKILLPDKPSDYALFIDDMYCAYHLYLNGELVAKNGTVSRDKSEYEPKWLPQFVPIENQKGEIILTLQVANFSHSKGGVSESILFGDIESIRSEFQTRKILDIVLMSLFVVLGLNFLWRFTLAVDGFESFFYALFCFVFGYHIIASKFYVLHQWFPAIPWEVAIRFEYLALVFSSVFFGTHIWYLYKKETARWYFYLFTLLNTLYGVMVIFTNVPFFTAILNYYLIFVIISLFYAFTIYITAFGKQIRGSGMGVISAMIIFAVMIFRILGHFKILPYLEIVSFSGYVLFLIFQSLQLIRHENKTSSESF